MADQIRRLLGAPDPTEVVSGTIGLLRLVEGEGSRVRTLIKQLASANEGASIGSARGLHEAIKREARGYLQMLPAELDIELDPGYMPSALERIERLCRRFSRVAAELRHRRSGKAPFEVEDEYDLQDLFRALLCLEFDDVRAEDPTSKLAGASSRIDFALPGEDVLVEVKMTRAGLTDKEVGEELLVDLVRYRTHPSARAVVCFIYDPKHHVRNPDGLKADLEKQSDSGFTVKAFIEPRK